MICFMEKKVGETSHFFTFLNHIQYGSFHNPQRSVGIVISVILWDVSVRKSLQLYVTET